jgi:hypothetical protein
MITVYFYKSKARGAFVEIFKNHAWTGITIRVKDKREARRVAFEHGGICWNF